MTTDLLASVLLPLMLAFIMFTLGLGLRPADFRHIAKHPKAFFIGVFSHFILLPLVCLGLLTVFPLPGTLAVGFMLIAACPTGTTSNLLTYIARGDVALALSFTGAASLLTIFTLPLILSASMTHFLGAGQQIDFPVGIVMAQVLAILGLPVSLGMLARHWNEALVLRCETIATRIATACFFLVVLGALSKNWKLFTAEFSTIAPMAVMLNLLMLAIGFGVAKIGRLDRRQSVTLAIETAMQNATLAIVISGSILHNDEILIPGAIYGILMYAGGLAFAFALRVGAPANNVEPVV